jgi:hypothetical protein
MCETGKLVSIRREQLYAFLETFEKMTPEDKRILEIRKEIEKRRKEVTGNQSSVNSLQ